MVTLKNLPIEFDRLLEKLSNYADAKSFIIFKENKSGFVEIKFYNDKSPGVLRIYCTKKGITVDGSTGKNIELNEELLYFINEITFTKETEEKRLNFKSISEAEYKEILKKISVYSDGDMKFYVEYIDSNANERDHLLIKNLKSKEEIHLIYYTNQSLYLRGFSWNLGEEIVNIICKAIDRVQYKSIDYLNEIIHDCNEKYILADGKECENCENNCYGNCSRFLQEIHYGNKTRYSCDKIMYFYLPKYGYRYAYEIERLLQDYLYDIKRFESLNILSIGCGPCTELFGLANICDSHNKPVKYEGIDLNKKWENIHRLIKEKFSSNITLRFYYKDIFDFINHLNSEKKVLKINIVIFQYVISDIIKYKSREEVCIFLRKLVIEIITYLPSGALIIFNDINHKEKARDSFDYLESLLSKDNYEILKYHFEGKTEEYYIYGEKIEDNRVPYQIPDYIDNRYSPWIMCRSAALIIRKV